MAPFDVYHAGAVVDGESREYVGYHDQAEGGADARLAEHNEGLEKAAFCCSKRTVG